MSDALKTREYRISDPFFNHKEVPKLSMYLRDTVTSIYAAMPISGKNYTNRWNISYFIRLYDVTVWVVYGRTILMIYE